MNEFMNGQISNSQVSHFNTMNIDQASRFLGAHKETVRRMVASGEIPGAKIGRSWIFLEQDLVIHMRKKYSTSDASQGVYRSNVKWHSTKEKEYGGLTSITKESEYEKLLGLR